MKWIVEQRNINGLVQERRNSMANALDLRLSCTNPSICCAGIIKQRVYTHYIDIIMGAMASRNTSLTIVYSIVYSAQIKENIKAPRHWPLWGEFTGGFPAQRSVTRKKIPFDDVIMRTQHETCTRFMLCRVFVVVLYWLIFFISFSVNIRVLG